MAGSGTCIGTGRASAASPLGLRFAGRIAPGISLALLQRLRSCECNGSGARLGCSHKRRPGGLVPTRVLPAWPRTWERLCGPFGQDWTTNALSAWVRRGRRQPLPPHCYTVFLSGEILFPLCLARPAVRGDHFPVSGRPAPVGNEFAGNRPRDTVLANRHVQPTPRPRSLSTCMYPVGEQSSSRAPAPLHTLPGLGFTRAWSAPRPARAGRQSRVPALRRYAPR